MKRISQISVYIIIIILAALNFISSPVALILGFLFTLVLGHPFPVQSKRAIQILLKISIIGLGFGMSVIETIKASKEGFVITALSIFITIGLGLLLIKVLKIDKKLGFLMTSGTSICGGSAIAAISPVIKANPKTISIAIGIVFLLNSIALLIFPSLGHLFHLSQTQFGTWCAIAIHDTSSVVGAALEYGDQALQIATTVKLARTLWIIPLSFFAMALFKSKNQKIKIPYFILGFIAAMLINSYHLIPELVSLRLVDISKRLLIITLFLVGASLSVKDIKETGFKPILFSTILWVFISVFSLVFIINF
ncbi:YeiH family protein [Xanthomarina spongicola]|uniref:Putative integral membrane protein (TIGR00698 family) n=1 Tax=Xanthomarina spongicola TaxID=570520 RepID=A0A316DP60_9FLAO|nr:putative sulfate exporter family transporter [Xanthomarina spongicola]PWK19298.1 putative integral membrane protein (TIGR00698 family) [Xanthomarina spongicola]